MNVSVVIPLYNKVRHIRRAVESVLAQTFSDFELLVIDDGSTDGSAEAVRAITDRRIRLIVQSNAGECAARNRGIREAACELVAFLDADDEWLPGFLATVMDLRSRYPEAGMYATAYCFCEGEKTWSPAYLQCGADPQGGLLEDYFRAALGPSPVTSSSVMIPRHVFKEAGLFPVGVRRGGDVYTWVGIALRYPVAWSPATGAVYHLSADNRVCTSVPLTHDISAADVIEQFLQAGYEPVAARSQVIEYLASVRLDHALSCYLLGRKDWALRLLDKAAGTRMFRKKRLLLLCLVRLPVPVLKGCLAAKTLGCRIAVSALPNLSRSIAT
jgi:glycosyltransferase involved in cell wall biosynthesis